MEINRLADLRPRFVWDILDDAFDLYRERFAPLCGTALIACLPLAGTEITLASRMAHTSAAGGDTSDLIFTNFLTSLPFVFIAMVFGGAAISVIVRDRLEGRSTTIAGAYREILRHIGPLIGATLIVVLFGMLGILTLGIGTLAVCVYASFIGPAILLENRGALKAWTRSSDLARSDSTRLLGVLCLMLLIAGSITLFLAGVLELIYTIVPSAGDAVGRELQRQIAQGAAFNLALLVLCPLPITAVTLFYYDLRVRREGIDIASQAAQLGVELAPDPFGDISSARVVSKQRKANRQKKNTPSSSIYSRPPGGNRP